MLNKIALAAAAAAAIATAAPVVAEQATTQDPFVATQGLVEIPALVVLGGLTTLLAIGVSTSGTD